MEGNNESGVATVMEVLLVNVVLLLPAAVFWSSVVLWVSLGTDWLFDAVLDPLGQTFWGNLLLIAGVIGMPGLAIGMNGLVYLKARAKIAWWCLALAVIFLALGFLAAVRKT
jgi:hypothetical protein